jgi:hypothetical protein
MKQIISIFCLIFLAGNVIAQPTKGTPALDKTGGWIYIGSMGNQFSFDPVKPNDTGFPTMNFPAGGGMKPNPLLAEKLVKLRNIIKEAYPNPQGTSIIYGLSAMKDKKPEDPRFVWFYLNGHGLENDGKGGLSQMNLASAQGDTKFTDDQPDYNGLFSVYINKIPYDEVYSFFQKQKQFDEILKTKQIPNVSGIYMMPPKNNFAEEAESTYFKNLKIPQPKIGNEADKFTVFRFVRYFDDTKYGMVERHMDKIIMNSYGKLPYKPLTRKEFIAVLKLHLETKLEKLKTQTGKNSSKNIENGINEIAAIEKLRELNQNSLDKPAILDVKHRKIVDQVWAYANNSKNYPELQIGKLKEVFIDDLDIGYTPCKLIQYYKSPKDEDIQSIMVNWYYEIPVGNNPNFDKHPSQDNRSFYQAMKNKLRWDKLESLLTR